MTVTLLLDVTVRAVAAALLHSLWQGAIVAAIMAAVWWALRGGRPNARYALGCLALAIMVAAWAATAWRTAAQLIPDTAFARAQAPAVALGPAGPFDYSPAIRTITQAERLARGQPLIHHDLQQLQHGRIGELAPARQHVVHLPHGGRPFRPQHAKDGEFGVGRTGSHRLGHGCAGAYLRTTS